MTKGTNPRRSNGHDISRIGVEAQCPICGASIETQDAHDRVHSRLLQIEQQAAAEAQANVAAQVSRVQREAAVATKAAVEKARQEATTKAQAAIAQAKKDAAAQVAKAKQDAVAGMAGKVAEAVNQEKARGYAERLKLTEQLEDLKRRLEKRTANELGEEGELDILAMLTEAFPGDEISRVPRGKNGGDLVHKFIQGSIAGKLLVESKNTKIFQQKWLAVARKNQIQEGAAHVVIVAAAFPAGHRELMVKDGVLVCSPARLVAVITWLRAQTIRSQSLMLSNQQRLDKAGRLYTFMCSDKTQDRWSRTDQTIKRMKDALRTEKLQHEKLWSDRGDQMDVLSAIRESFVADLDAIFESTDAEAVS